MNTKIDWHYHVSGRNILNDVTTLQKYIEEEKMDEVYVMASYFPENGSGVSNYNLYHHLAHIDKVKLYLSLDLNSYFFMGLNEITNILVENADNDKIVGIKIYTGYQDVDLKGEKFLNVIELAKSFGIVVMFHTGYLKGNKENFNPLLLEDTFKNHPEVPFIIAHLSNPFIDEAIYLLDTYDNLRTDISGLIDRRVELEETLLLAKRVSDKIHPDKVLFGTDYPMQNYETTLIFAQEFL